MRGATSEAWTSYMGGYFNPRSSCEERHEVDIDVVPCPYFNPRSSCEERPVSVVLPVLLSSFQSTLLMRGATASQKARVRSGNFNPRSSCEERQRNRINGSWSIYFNPRSSCEERLFIPFSVDILHHFNPRSSCEERRRQYSGRAAYFYFNPRSSCEERPGGWYRGRRCANFNPRSSCEERPTPTLWSSGVFLFQSTLLMRGATHTQGHFGIVVMISIHAPHARSDARF